MFPEEDTHHTIVFGPITCKKILATLQFELATTYLLKIFSKAMTQKENGLDTVTHHNHKRYLS